MADTIGRRIARTLAGMFGGQKSEGEPMRPFSGSRGNPRAHSLNTIFWQPGRGVPRMEDLLTTRLLSQSHTVSIPKDTISGQITTTDWAIVPTVDNPTSAHETAADAITEFLDGGFNRNPTTFDALCRAWLNDLLDIDAGILELVPDDAGWLREIYVRDGATFTKAPDRHGRLPDPPEPAYYQIGVQYGLAGHHDASSISDLFRDATRFGGMGYQRVAPIGFSRDEILWLEENPRTFSVYGRGRTQKVQLIVETLLNQDLSNQRYFPANEVPEGALNLVEANADEIARFREYWSDEIAGKPHKMPILGAKNLQWLPFRASPRELEFLESQKWYHELVWLAFGLSPNEVGHVADVNRSTAQEQTEAIWRKTTLPLLELLKNALNRFVLPFIEEFWDVDGELEFVWDPRNLTIERAKRAEERNDLRLGLTTPNRVLRRSGEDDVPWGDIPLTLFESLCRTHPEWVAREIVGIQNAPEPLWGGVGMLSTPNPSEAKIARQRAPVNDDEPPEWTAYIEAVHRRVGGVMRDELAWLEDAVREAFPAEVSGDSLPAVDARQIADRIDITDALLTATDDARAGAMQRGADLEARQLEQELGKRAGGQIVRIKRPQIDVRDSAAFRQLRLLAAQNMRSVSQTTKDRIQDTLVRVIAEGGNVTDAWLALQETIASLTTEYARLVARTEVMSAARRGSQALGEQVPDLVDGKTWKSRKIRGRTRSWHAAMDGITVPVGDAWEVPHTGDPGQPNDYPRTAFVVGEDQPFNCMCNQRLHLRETLPTDAGGLRSVACLTVLSQRQAEVLEQHGAPGEDLRALLERIEDGASRNEAAKLLGIGKATLYEWRRQEGLDV